MTRQQMAALVVTNAIISLLIALAVMLVFERTRQQPLAVPTPPVAADAGDPSDKPEPATPAETPIPVATYVVQAGDSLGAVAFRFGITLDALMAANGLENANYVVEGTSLEIPAGAVARPATPTPLPGPTVAAVATTQPGVAPIIIEAIFGAGNVGEEHVRLVNRGAEGVALEGWMLRDADGHDFTFPNLFLWRNGTVSVHTGSGQNTATDLYWGLDVPVWDRADDTISLLDATGEVIATSPVGASGGG